MEQTQYKRQDRSVSPRTAQLISKSLKSFNATHPRGTVDSGSKWAQRIQKGVKDYWSKIPPKPQSGTTIDNLV